MELFEQLKQRSAKHVKNFLSDFEIDKKAIESKSKTPFIHISRTNGTAMTFLHPTEDYPEKGKKSKYLFGISSRLEILKGEKESLKYYILNDAKCIFFSDNKTLVKINEKTAFTIFEKHYNSLIHLWENEA